MSSSYVTDPIPVNLHLRDLYPLSFSCPIPSSLPSFREPQKYQSSWVDLSILTLYKERWPGHQWAMAPFLLLKALPSSLYLSQLNPLTSWMSNILGLGLVFKSSLLTILLGPAFNCLLFLLFDVFFLFNDLQAPVAPRLYKHQGWDKWCQQLYNLEGKHLKRI